MQIVVNCETRLCSQFLGPGDNFLQSYGAIFTDRAATGSGNLKNSRGIEYTLKLIGALVLHDLHTSNGCSGPCSTDIRMDFII